MGKQAIPYCVARADDYPLSQSQVEYLVSESMLKWKEFFNKYGSETTNILNHNGSGLNFNNPTWPTPELKLNVVTSGIRLLAQYDTRDNALNAHSGTFFEFNSNFARRSLGGSFNYE